jgi:hypothetical protein
MAEEALLSQRMEWMVVISDRECWEGRRLVQALITVVVNRVR